MTVSAVTAPHEWLPSRAGLEAVQRLAEAPVWREVELVATSPAPKARATAETIALAGGVPLREERDLREVERPPALLDVAAHRDHVRRYLEHEPVPGWEARDDACRRFERCIDALIGDTTGSLAVVSHGTVLALYVGLTFAEWEAIRLPAVAVVDPATRRLLRPFADVDTFTAT